MLISSKLPAVADLVKRWESTKGSSAAWRERKSHDLRRDLAHQIIEPLLAKSDGQLALTYQRFLTMRPTGVHSFAHGSEMGSQTVYWVRVGRIDGPRLQYVRAHSRMVGRGEVAFRIGTAPEFRVPLRTESLSLSPRYASGKHEPYFVVREKKPDEVSYPPSFSLDVSSLGNHLFNTRPDRYDWYTLVELVLGTKAVRAWLTEHGSEETFLALKARL